MIDIENISNNTLLCVIKDDNYENWEFFALKVLISRFKLKLSMIDEHKVKQRKEMAQQCCAEMRELLVKSQFIPRAYSDLQTIMERYGEGG